MCTLTGIGSVKKNQQGMLTWGGTAGTFVKGQSIHIRTKVSIGTMPKPQYPGADGMAIFVYDTAHWNGKMGDAGGGLGFVHMKGGIFAVGIDTWGEWSGVGKVAQTNSYMCSRTGNYHPDGDKIPPGAPYAVGDLRTGTVLYLNADIYLKTDNSICIAVMLDPSPGKGWVGSKYIYQGCTLKSKYTKVGVGISAACGSIADCDVHSLRAIDIPPQAKPQFRPALAGHPGNLPSLWKRDDKQQRSGPSSSSSSPPPRKHRDALDTVVDLGTTVDAVDEESARRIELLEAALCASDQRRREAEEESRRARELYDDTQRELDGAVAEIAALADRLRDKTCLESFNEATRRRTSQLLDEAQAQLARDAAASRARIAELEARRVEDSAASQTRIAQLEAELDGAVAQIAALNDRLRDMACLESFNEVTHRRTSQLLDEAEAQFARDIAVNRARIAELEARRVQDAAASQTRIARLEAELADVHRQRDAAEARSQRHAQLADQLRSELRSAAARATALAGRVDDGSQRIAELTAELARARGALDAAETARGAALAQRDEAVARVDQGQRLARRLCAKLCEMERALKAKATTSADSTAAARHPEGEALLALGPLHQLAAASRHCGILLCKGPQAHAKPAKPAKPGEQDENARPNFAFCRPASTNKASTIPVTDLIYTLDIDARFRDARQWLAREVVKLWVSRAGAYEAQMLDGIQLLTGSFDQTVRVHGLKLGSTIKVFRGHTSFVNDVCYAQSGAWVISGSSDGTVRIWDARSEDCLDVLRPVQFLANVLADRPDTPVISVALAEPIPSDSDLKCAQGLERVSLLLHEHLVCQCSDYSDCQAHSGGLQCGSHEHGL
eukprot:m51a1_g12074 hypothetical protein (850) ;mRNA; f:174-5703